MKEIHCIYCDRNLLKEAFSLEHIWPDALGGNLLPELWKTRNVCRQCNNIAGVFVDAKFIKSWFGNAERGEGALEYLNLKSLDQAIVPITYFGRLVEAPTTQGEIVESYAGPCGAHIWHVRPNYKDDWFGYVGGDPRKQSKKKYAGRVYITLTSSEPLWVDLALNSVIAHFRYAEKFITNASLEGVPQNFPIKEIDEISHEYPDDIKVMEWKRRVESETNRFHIRPEIQLNFELRFLAKVALGIGCKLFGNDFAKSQDGSHLRNSMREANLEKQKTLEMMGAGYLANPFGKVAKTLHWSGGWVLVVKRIKEQCAFAIITPLGNSMIVPITKNAVFANKLSSKYDDGVVWLTVPPAGVAIGPIPLPEYIAHKLGNVRHSDLLALESRKIDVGKLPPCT